jgi:hypothetical protein
MNREDIVCMAREAGVLAGYEGEPDNLIRFAALVAAAEREILADWMRQHGFSTGQAYTTATLLDRLGTEMVENTDAAVLEEREACAKLAAIRARSDE